MQEFFVSTHVRDGCQILAVHGDLDEATALALDDAIDGSESSSVILDVSLVDFISSAGIHTLLRERPVGVALVCPHGNVARLFQIVTAQRRVRLFVDLDNAIENVAPIDGPRSLVEV